LAFLVLAFLLLPIACTRMLKTAVVSHPPNPGAPGRAFPVKAAGSGASDASILTLPP